MHAEDFIERVRERGGLDSTDAARTVTETTLGLLGERVTRGEAEDIAAGLPDELATALTAGSSEHPDDRPVEDVIEAVAEAEGADPRAAKEHVRAVTATLTEATDVRDLQDALEQLPNEFAALFESPDPDDATAAEGG